MTISQTDIVIIGAGPAGLFSVFQAGQLGLKCQVIDILEQPGGQCAELYPDKPIYDIPGIPHCSGASLTAGLMAQIERFSPVFHFGAQADRLERQADGRWRIGATDGSAIDARAVVVAAGAGCFTPRKLALDDALAYEGKSLLYSVKNVEQFSGKRLLILGGGDSALDWAIALEQVASRVTMVHRRDVFRATPESVERLHQLVHAGRIDLHFGSISALKGKGNNQPDQPDLSGAVLSGADGSTTELDCDIILAFFGLTNKLGPISQWGIGAAEDEIPVDPVTMQTGTAGIYAVGDIAQYPGKLKLILSGFGEAALMGHAVYEYLNGEKPRFQYSTHSQAMQSGVSITNTETRTEALTEAANEADRHQAIPSATAPQTDPAAVPHVLVTDLAGNEHSLPARPGRSLLEIMDAAKMPVKGSCFGACNCSTCHVYVDEAWFDQLEPMIDQEQEALDQVSAPKPVSRLACQIEFRPELSGMKVKLTVDTIPD